MARLIVESMSEDTIAAPGNRALNYLVASVTDVNGQPVTGLAAANFRVEPLIVGPGGSLVNIASVSPGIFPGFYHINVVPIPGQTWKGGVYIFAVAVQRAADHGQSLAKVKMD
jgi:hypothetical protein